MSYLTYNGKLVQSNNKFVIQPTSSIPSLLNLTWNNISNVPVANPASLSDWNTFFNLPTLGTAFTSVAVNGNVVSLGGGANINTKANLFNINTNLVKFVDNINCIIGVGGTSFSGCSALTEVSLPACSSTYTVTSSTPNGSFQNCTSLVTANFPAMLDIGIRGFSGCTNLSTVNFPSLEIARDYAFASTKIVSPSFPALINAYPGAFSSCYQLTSPSFPNLQYIFNGCFANDSSLVSLNFPSVISVGNQAFYYCTNLQTLHIEGPTVIGSSVLNDNVFQNDVSMLDLYVNISTQTNNAGGPDGDITYLQGIAPSVTIHYVA